MTDQQAAQTDTGAREYRKTATIQAVQYLGQHVEGVCTGGTTCKSKGAPEDCVPHIHGLEGDLTVSHGDWIATGVQGEHWAIKPDVFAASYELAALRATTPATAGAREEPVALAHIRETDTYPLISIEVLDGTCLQPSMSPVKLYAAPPAQPAGGEIAEPLNGPQTFEEFDESTERNWPRKL